MNLFRWFRIKKEVWFCNRMIKNSLMSSEEAKQYLNEKFVIVSNSEENEKGGKK